jgi:protein-S-isoprenylcysteine O-methyltransferase Ste14
MCRFNRPLGLGDGAGALGWALAFRSLIGILPPALVRLIARMDAEEAMLRSQFGAEYEAYYGKTRRLLPRLYGIGSPRPQTVTTILPIC